MAMTMTPTTAAAMGAVQRDKAGVGSAVLNSARQVGGSLGIAIIGAIVASGISSGLAAGDTRQVAFIERAPRRPAHRGGDRARRLGGRVRDVRKQPHHYESDAAPADRADEVVPAELVEY